jgi:hypothetical protein
MKISDNMTDSSFLWQLRSLRAAAVLFVIFAFVVQQYFIDLIAFAGVVMVASLLFARRRANFLLEVFDYGDCLKLKLDSDELLVKLSALEKVEIRDGKDGLDWVAIQLGFDSKFGRLIQFYPNMATVPMGRLDIWVVAFNERISAAPSASE